MKTMKIYVKEMTMVKPAEKMPRKFLWLSDMDLLYCERQSVFISFYRPNGASKFFDPTVLKRALAKALVPFYPIAGRYRRDQDDRLEIKCNDEGVLFIDAECNLVLDYFGDFAPTPELRRLIPTIDYSGGIASYPFLLAQVTHFQCGGVSLGVTIEHGVTDGPAVFHFISAWSEIARGLDLTIPPFLDRTILRPRNPPQLMFNHIEYQVTPAKDTSQITKVQYDVAFKITREQLNILKNKSREGGIAINYTTFEVLAGHIWKCACIARALPKDQETKLFFLVNGRYSKLQPPLPPGYFGSVVFPAISVAIAGDLQSKPLWYAANLIHETLVRLDNNYLRSAIDYLKLHPGTKRYGPHDYGSPNFAINSWVKLPTHDADFGWGKPFYTGPGEIIFEGKAVIFSNDVEDESLSVAVALPPEHIKMFEKAFYEFDGGKKVRNSNL